MIEEVFTFVNKISECLTMCMFISCICHLFRIFERDTVSIEKEVEWYLCCGEMDDRSMSIYSSDDIFDRAEYHRTCLFSFCDDTKISKLYLFERCICILCEIVHDIERVYETDDAVELHSSSHIIHEK